MKKFLFVILFLLTVFDSLGQGKNSNWLLGFGNWPTKAILQFDNTSYLLGTGPRKMGFQGTEATICDDQGNFLMSSNGVWIANANNDTMMNGGGLNPGVFTSSWPNGLPIIGGNIIIPFPGDSLKYVLIHQTEESQSGMLGGIYKSVVDMSYDGGLGGLLIKNDTLLIDTISWGLTACKHANGRDWWVIAQQDSSSSLYEFLLTPNGIDTIIQINLNYSPFSFGNGSQITFSRDGKKFIQTNYDNPVSRNSYLIVSDFDRCAGTFSNTISLPITNGSYLWGLAFSPNGQYAYTCSSNFIFQIDVNTLSVDTVAIYDGFCFPNSPWCTTFFNMYLAANGKIYITSGSGVQHIHEMNYPDSAGIACDVQQHAINLNGVWSFRAVPNHPNYYLGAADGTVCDSLGLNPVNELTTLDGSFQVLPSPNDGNFSILYLLPQNHHGNLEIFDLNGKIVHGQILPPWSTMQTIALKDVPDGIYLAVISSREYRTTRKVVIAR